MGTFGLPIQAGPLGIFQAKTKRLKSKNSIYGIMTTLNPYCGSTYRALYKLTYQAEYQHCEE